jgi:hypothetical protein
MKIGEKILKSKAYHWTLQNYYDSLTNSGFNVRSIIEPKLKRASNGANSECNDAAQKYPKYIIFDCIKRT